MSTAGEFLPPLVTVLKGDISDLAAAFAEAKKLKGQWKKDMESTKDSMEKVESAAQNVTETSVAMEESLSGAAKRGKGAVAELTEGTEALRESVRGARVETTRASREVTEYERIVTNRMRLGQTAVSAMREEYHRLRQRVRDLREEFDRPFSTRRAGVFGELSDALADVRRLESYGERIGVDLAEGTGRGFVATLQGFVSTPIIGPIIAGTVVAAVIAAGPAIGAAVATAVGLGLGAGVIALGVSILKDDKQVKKQWEKLTATSSKTFEKAAQPLKKPFIEVMKTLQIGFKGLEAPLKRIFAAAAPLVAPLAAGIFGMLSNMLPGIEAALINLQPVFAQLGEDLPVIGIALGSFFEDITEHGPEMSIFLHDMIYMIAGGIAYLGEFIGWLTVAYVWVRDLAKNVKDGLGEAWKAIKNWAKAQKEWAKNALSEVGAWLMFGFMDGIRSGWNSIKSDIASIFGNVTVVAKKTFDSHSPSRVFMGIGRDTVTGFAMGVKQSAPQAWAAWAGLIAPRGSRGTYDAGGGAAMALASGGGGGGAAARAAVLIHNGLKLDGKTVYEAIIPHSQRGGARNVTTGLTRSGVGVMATA